MPLRTTLVTGATDGIGRQTALELLHRGERVLVHGRSAAKAEAAAKALSREARSGEAVPVFGDFASMRQVRALGEAVLRAAPTLDVLINNAGIFANERLLTEDGFESTFAVNHFAPFLLTHQLLPALERAPQGRVVNVSSVAHRRGEIPFDDMTYARGFDGYVAYAASKLANILFTVELARRLPPTRVTAHALHPGVIATKLLKAGFGGMGGSPLEEGPRTSVYVATAPEVAAASGRYFSESRETSASANSRDEAAQRRLYALSAQLTAITPLPEPPAAKEARS